MSPDQLQELRAFFSSEFEKLHADFGTLRDEVGTLRDEVGTLRAEVGTLRNEVGTLRNEVGTLRREVGTLRRDFYAFQDYVTSYFGKVDGRLDALERDLSAERVRREEMQSQLEKVAEAVTTTRDELSAFRAETREEFASVRKEMEVGLTGVRSDMAERFDSLDARIGRLEAA